MAIRQRRQRVTAREGGGVEAEEKTASENYMPSRTDLRHVCYVARPAATAWQPEGHADTDMLASPPRVQL